MHLTAEGSQCEGWEQDVCESGARVKDRKRKWRCFGEGSSQGSMNGRCEGEQVGDS